MKNPEITDVQDYLKKDRFAAILGIEILEVGNGSAKAKLELNGSHLNSMDTVHGGAIFSLADMTLAAAAHSYGTVAVAINVNISFLKAVSKGTLYAKAEEISRNSKIGCYTIHITDAQGALISCVQGMAYFKKDLL
jgi:acyl-CoA thioesterase